VLLSLNFSSSKKNLETEREKVTSKLDIENDKGSLRELPKINMKEMVKKVWRAFRKHQFYEGKKYFETRLKEVEKKERHPEDLAARY